MPTFNKSKPLTRAHFAEFKKAFGLDPYGKSSREDEGKQGRFRCFDRGYIRENANSLDITWLNEDGDNEPAKISSPDVIAEQIETNLKSALMELGTLMREMKSRR